MHNKTVLLFGGFSGWLNFGDLAQLKSWILYYKNKGFRSLILLNKNCLSNTLQYELLKGYFSENLIFYENRRFYDHLLNIIDKGSIDFFHVYGGGFLNSYWGKNKIEIMERAINFFKPKKYFITGQQISKEFMIYLKKHIDLFKPDIVAVRDRESLRFCNDMNIPAVFSFDDSVEYFNYLRNRLDFETNVEKKETKILLLHLNLSYYVLESEDEIWVYRYKIKETVNSADKLYLVKAYQSYNIEVKDTFRAIDYLYLTLDKPSGIFIDLMAMLQREEYGQLSDILSSSDNILAITNSYHTSLFFCFMGIPSYLLRLNPYYEHKGKEIFEDFELSAIWNNLSEIKEKQQKNLEYLIKERNNFLDNFGRIFLTGNKENDRLYGKFTYSKIPEKLIEKIEIDSYIKQLMNDINWYKNELEIIKYYSDRLNNKINLLNSEIEILKHLINELKNILDRIYSSRGWRLLTYYYKLKHQILSKLGIINDGN